MSYRSRCALALGISVLGVGCARHTDASPAGGASAAGSASAGIDSLSALASTRPSAVAARRAVPPPGASAGAPVELSEAQKEAELRYRAALQRGRRATLTKNYDRADAAFTEALTARPADTRALAERGFARMQAGQLDLAADDFRTADGRTRDPALAGQIFFNQGLLAERQGDLENAKVAYARSQLAHPTPAAKNKLAALGGSACTAAFAPLSQPLQHYANWVAFWETLGEMDTYETDDEVKKALQVEDCHEVCAVGGSEWHIVLPSVSGLDVLRSVDRGGFARCGTSPQFSFERRGSLLRITSTNEELEVSLCDEHCDNADGLCATCCADGPSHRYDTFLDLSARSALLRVSQYAANGAHFEPLPVTLDAQNTVHVQGGGCDRAVPLALAGPGGKAGH